MSNAAFQSLLKILTSMSSVENNDYAVKYVLAENAVCSSDDWCIWISSFRQCDLLDESQNKVSVDQSLYMTSSREGTMKKRLQTADTTGILVESVCSTSGRLNKISAEIQPVARLLQHTRHACSVHLFVIRMASYCRKGLLILRCRLYQQKTYCSWDLTNWIYYSSMCLQSVRHNFQSTFNHPHRDD